MPHSKVTKHEHHVHHTAADHHRKAAHHFEAAAKHQILAAEADDNDDEVVTAHHAYLAYGHQLQAIHFAEWLLLKTSPLIMLTLITATTTNIF